MELEIRSLTRPEVGTLINWAAAEGWNPGLHDAASFHSADAEGFLGGFLGGELVTGISAVRYGTDFGFIGLFITRPDLRYQGYGRAIWNAAMIRLNSCTIGLDGVPEQQASYQSKGFEHAYGTTRYSGVLTDSNSQMEWIQPVESAIHVQLQAYDRLHFPGARKPFLREWLQQAHCSLVYSQDNQILGYGVARACRDGYKIGPLFAQSIDVAVPLVSALGAACAGEVHIDVPDDQHLFIDRLKKWQLTPGFSTARMYRGKPPTFANHGVFGVTSLELG